MTSQYLVRVFEFAYNDETYQLDGDLGAIKAVFDDAASAQAKMESLTVAYLRAEELSNYEPFTEADEDFVERINSFCMERCGEPLFDEDNFINSIPEGLSDADVLELVQLTGFHPYKMVEVPADGFVALWLIEEEQFAGTYSVNVDYQPSVEAFMENLPSDIQSSFSETLHGTYEELSETPVLLRQLVASKRGLLYDEQAKTLSLEPWGVAGADLFALNALLRKPVFEVRKLTVEDLLAMNA